MIIEINYDLKNPGQNYTGLIEKIKALGSSWARPCASCWLISTSSSVSSVTETLKAYIDRNDRLLVSQFNANNYSGWLDQEVIDWIRRNSNAYQEFR